MLLLRDCNKGQNLVKSGLTKHEEQGAMLQGMETLTVRGPGTDELNRREALSLHPLSPGHKQWASLKMYPCSALGTVISLSVLSRVCSSYVQIPTISSCFLGN